MDRERIFKILENDVDKITVAHALDCAEMVSDKNMIKETPFLDPYHVEIIQKATNGLFGVKSIAHGGFSDSERKKIIFYPDFLKVEDIEPEISFIEVLGINMSKYSHRDYLGSILGLGLKRDKVGDIIVFDEGCQIVVSNDILDYLLLNLTKIGNAKVEVKEIYPHQLKIAPSKVKEISGTVASLRLDAVASLGFGLSRTKIGVLIKSEKAKVQYKTISNPAYQINQGEIISLRGRGRIEIADVGNLTKKNRIHVTIKKYV